MADVDTVSVGCDRGTAGTMACGFCCGGLVRVGGGNYCARPVWFVDLISIMSAIAHSAVGQSFDLAAHLHPQLT